MKRSSLSDRTIRPKMVKENGIIVLGLNDYSVVAKEDGILYAE